MCPVHPKHSSLPQIETHFLVPCFLVDFNGVPLFNNALLGLDMPRHPYRQFFPHSIKHQNESFFAVAAILTCVLSTNKIPISTNRNPFSYFFFLILYSRRAFGAGSARALLEVILSTLHLLPKPRTFAVAMLVCILATHSTPPISRKKCCFSHSLFLIDFNESPVFKNAIWGPDLPGHPER
jgi:hypothetical protein